MTKIKINVTQEILQKSSMCGMNINEGVGNNCAIALAVREIFPAAWVEDTRILPFYSEKKTTFKNIYDFKIALPTEATDFINLFDNYRPELRVKMTPISFEVEIPENVIDKLAEGWEEVLVESKTLELV